MSVRLSPAPLKVPFRPNGDLAHYPGCSFESSDSSYEWRDNYVFDAGLALVDFDFGRSARNVVLYDTVNCCHYVMMIRDFLAASRRALVSRGVDDRGQPATVFSHLWTFHRGGNNYFVKPVDD